MLFWKKRLFSDQKLLGRWGEKRCLKFLKRKGLHPLTRNFSCKLGEIDLIMVDSIGSIVFVEVKCRSNENFTPTETLITADKQQKMSNTARVLFKNPQY